MQTARDGRMVDDHQLSPNLQTSVDMRHHMRSSRNKTQSTTQVFANKSFQMTQGFEQFPTIQQDPR